MKKRQQSNSESGQAMVEYLLLLGIVAGLFLIVAQGLERSGLAKNMAKPITVDFAAAYQFGHTKAKGPDNGGPEMHPRWPEGNNFRIFMNPKIL